MTQKTGALIFDETADRYDIRFDLNDYYGGLHCGDCLTLVVLQVWAYTLFRKWQLTYLSRWSLKTIHTVEQP